MTLSQDPHAVSPQLVDRMRTQVQAWQAVADGRALFLDCYQLMTRNMFTALAAHEFSDRVWVDRLLHRFADYYFDALSAYERDPAAAPAVWRLAHDAACRPGTAALRKVLLGINAHINYDLVLTVADLLQPEWPDLTAAQRAGRQADHEHVNDVIGRTIDAVQDQILDPAMPLLDVFDRLLGPLDELLISRVITSWRATVWRNALALIETTEVGGRQRLIAQVETDALTIGRRIGG